MMMHSVVGPGPGGSTGGSIEKKSNLSLDIQMTVYSYG